MPRKLFYSRTRTASEEELSEDDRIDKKKSKSEENVTLEDSEKEADIDSSKSSSESDEPEEKSEKDKVKEAFLKVLEEHQKHERYLAKSTRPEYTEREKKIMLYYLILNDCIFRAKGLDIWQTMIDNGYLVHRTPLSLFNHFTKHLLPNLHRYRLPKVYHDDFMRIMPKPKK